MEFISQYFIVILAIIIMFIIFIIVIITRNTKTMPLELRNKETKKKKEIKKDTKKNNSTEKTKEKKIEQKSIPAKKRIKRELIAHDKIQKKDFKKFKDSRILIAEDNLINQKVIINLLDSSGIDIVVANDGQECVDILKKDKKFSLILMDVHMPVLDGFQATRLIRKIPQYEHIPIIALSGDISTDDIQNMLDAGMEAHLEKPLKLDAFYDILYSYTSDEKMISDSNKIKKSIEFDIYRGLEICGNDKEFYLEILNDFITNYEDASQKIQQFLSERNSIDADKMLLDILGLAANIGAEHLHSATLELKRTIANPQDLEYIDALKKFKRSLAHISELIKAYKDNS